MAQPLKRPENWVNKFEIDTAGGQDPLTDAANAKFAKLSQGIISVTPAANETDDTQSFWEDEGFSETDGTGKRITYAFTGQRVVGDPAQDFVASKFWSMGDELRTLVRVTDQNGNTALCNATMTTIVPFGGNANARQTFSFTLSMNGKPVLGTGGQNNDDGNGLNGTKSGSEGAGLGDNNAAPKQ
ncbi:capsid protein [Furfurilactobacillus rossiae]|uniref:phage tail tube protein n=1 Tax=Furfurilactobacillus rossiae TaxID=231049 RepID=UPI001CDC884F|nr:capsid protein [Furfurilactobacillus rossiae]QLE64012.1 capsid protein [Furfurilactobacillus rossiae]